MHSWPQGDRPCVKFQMDFNVVTQRASIGWLVANALCFGVLGAVKAAHMPETLWGLFGSQLYDIVCMLILLGSSAILRAIRPGFIYYWLKVSAGRSVPLWACRDLWFNHFLILR